MIPDCKTVVWVTCFSASFRATVGILDKGLRIVSLRLVSPSVEKTFHSPFASFLFASLLCLFGLRILLKSLRARSQTNEKGEGVCLTDADVNDGEDGWDIWRKVE